MEESKLYIEDKNGIVKCNSFGDKGDLKYENDSVYYMLFPILNCSKSGSVVKIVRGKEWKIKGVRLDAYKGCNPNRVAIEF